MLQLVVRIIITVAFFIVAVATANISNAATYYVATTGNNANSGTESQPFRTINKGIGVMTTGDTLYIKGGTYAEIITSRSTTIPTGTSWNNAPVIAAYPGDQVILRPGSGGEAINLAAAYIQYLIIDGFIIDAVNVSFGVGMTNGANHVRFQNVEVKNSQKSGLLLTYGTGSTDYNEFINLKVHDNGTDDRLDHGLYFSTNNNIIEDCVIHDNAAYGVHIYNGTSGKRASSNIVRNNKAYNNGGSSGGGFGILLSSGDNNIAYNNLVWGNLRGGIEVQWRSPTNAKVYNNTVYANTGYGIEIGANSTNAIVKNNIIYQNLDGIINNNGAGTVLSNNLTTDPNFVDISAPDFYLQSGSPAIDAGTAIGEVTKDFNDIARPQGVAYDIGAYEYVSGQPILPNAPTSLVIRP